MSSMTALDQVQPQLLDQNLPFSYIERSQTKVGRMRICTLLSPLMNAQISETTSCRDQALHMF